MKIAVISDIHGNYEAFKQVLIDIDAKGISKIICLGDCIGYGPDPERVIQLVRNRHIPTLLGNHELAVRDKAHMNWFNPKARLSLEITLAMLSVESMDFIQTLPRKLVFEDGYFVHGFPPDSVRTYLFQKSEFELMAQLNQMSQKACFVGHTHDLEIVEYDGRRIERKPLAIGRTSLTESHQYIVNIGSVGQPRDGSNTAKYLIWNKKNNAIEIRSIPYDIQKVVDKITAAGLPEGNANRLW